MLTEKLKNVHRLQGKLMSEHYQRALAAKSEGRPVAYVTAMFPVEIVKAFEPLLATVYPENHAALLIARGQSQLVERAEAAGLDRMGCAYELYNTGYLLEGLGGQDANPLTDEKGRPISAQRGSILRSRARLGTIGLMPRRSLPKTILLSVGALALGGALPVVYGQLALPAPQPKAKAPPPVKSPVENQEIGTLPWGSRFLEIAQARVDAYPGQVALYASEPRRRAAIGINEEVPMYLASGVKL